MYGLIADVCAGLLGLVQPRRHCWHRGSAAGDSFVGQLRLLYLRLCAAYGGEPRVRWVGPQPPDIGRASVSGRWIIAGGVGMASCLPGRPTLIDVRTAVRRKGVAGPARPLGHRRPAAIGHGGRVGAEQRQIDVGKGGVQIQHKPSGHDVSASGKQHAADRGHPGRPGGPGLAGQLAGSIGRRAHEQRHDRARPRSSARSRVSRTASECMAGRMLTCPAARRAVCR